MKVAHYQATVIQLSNTAPRQRCHLLTSKTFALNMNSAHSSATPPCSSVWPTVWSPVAFSTCLCLLPSSYLHILCNESQTNNIGVCNLLLWHTAEEKKCCYFNISIIYTNFSEKKKKKNPAKFIQPNTFLGSNLMDVFFLHCSSTQVV